MAKRVDVAGIKFDYEQFKAEQQRVLSEQLADLKAQREELDQQIEHLEAVAAELTGEGVKKPAPAQSSKSGSKK